MQAHSLLLTTSGEDISVNDIRMVVVCMDSVIYPGPFSH